MSKDSHIVLIWRPRFTEKLPFAIMPVTMSEEKQSPESGSCISHERPALGRASIASTYNSLARTGGTVLSYHDVEMWGRRYSFIHTARSQPGVLLTDSSQRRAQSLRTAGLSLSWGTLCKLLNLAQLQSLYLLDGGNNYMFGRELLPGHNEIMHTENSEKPAIPVKKALA